MKKILKYTTNQLRDYASLFSRSEAALWLKSDFSSIDFKIKRYDNNWISSIKSTYLDYLKYVYSILANNYQNEYIYKNEFLNEWLIKELGNKDTSQVFNEFRVGKSIADLAMFNGCSKIFEIKTELDSKARLQLQIESYKMAFNQIYLIIPISKLDSYFKLDDSLGIIAFDKSNEKYFSLKRHAKQNDNIDSATVMSLLHTNEYKSIVKHYYGFLPELTSFNQYNICKEYILNIPSKELNQYFINELKGRKTSSALSTENFREFNQLFLALKINKKVKSKIINLLQTQIKA